MLLRATYMQTPPDSSPCQSVNLLQASQEPMKSLIVKAECKYGDWTGSDSCRSDSSVEPFITRPKKEHCEHTSSVCVCLSASQEAAQCLQGDLYWDY